MKKLVLEVEKNNEFLDVNDGEDGWELAQKSEVWSEERFPMCVESRCLRLRWKICGITLTCDLECGQGKSLTLLKSV